MNSIAEEQISKIIFNCSFCNYQSRLDLTECPECGRLRRVSAPQFDHRRGAVGYQLKHRENIGSGVSLFTSEPQAAAVTYVYECEHCHYQTRNCLFECPDCGRLKFAKIIAPESNAGKANNQDLHKKRKTRQLANRIIFENSHIFNVVILCALLFPAYFFRSLISAMLIYLLSMAVITFFCLFTYGLSVTIGIDGIAQKKIFSDWEVSWSEITGWNEFALGDGKSSICFRTGANVYKISPDLLNPARVEKIKEYFEEYCGAPLQGSNRIGGLWW
jgi:hypothetical protein